MTAIILYILIIGMTIYFIFGTSEVVIENDCTCGKYDKCVSKVIYKDHGLGGGYSLHKDPDEMMKCGKVKKQLEDIERLTKKLGL